jgi:ADP-ribosylglycohydrolase
MLGLAAGDALGAGYEFGAPPTGKAEMIGGGRGPWEPGEWTDDTQMAICIAEEAATGPLLPERVASRFLAWYHEGPKDVGGVTSDVLGTARSPAEVPLVAASRFARRPRDSAGNGSLMRTAPVALTALGDDRALAALATEVSALTHVDPLASDACVLWCVAIDRAVREGRLDGVTDGVGLLEPARRARWTERIEEARSHPPGHFTPNGFVVSAFQAALAAIWQTPVPDNEPSRHLVDALQAAVKIGDDTDTVAAIAGALLGGRWGASAVPPEWRTLLHGWPGYGADDLTRLALLTATQGRIDSAASPTAASQASGGKPSVAPLGPRFDQALSLASELHRSQFRKGTSVPYVSHLLAVCSIVLENGGDEDEAISALLHDAVEDQGGQPTLERVRQSFGERVAGIVAACSNTSEGTAVEARRAYLSRLDSDGVPRSVLLVSAADKLHNLRSMLADYDEVGEALWDRFHLTKEQQLSYYQSLADVYHRRLGGRLAKTLAPLVTQLATVVGAAGAARATETTGHAGAGGERRDAAPAP